MDLTNLQDQELALFTMVSPGPVGRRCRRTTWWDLRHSGRYEYIGHSTAPAQAEPRVTSLFLAHPSPMQLVHCP